MNESVDSLERESQGAEMMSVSRLDGKTRSEAFRFVVVGVFATAVHYSVYVLLQSVMNVSLAFTIGYALSWTANFFLTAFFTFHSRPSLRKGLGFGGAHAVNYLLQMALLHVFLWVGVARCWALLPVYAVSVPVNFLLIRFVFKHPLKK